MAFAIGNSSSIDNFISQLLAFAVANAGFTAGTTVYSSAGSGSQPIRSVTKGGVRWNFFYDPYGQASTYQGLSAFLSYQPATSGFNIGVLQNNKTGLNMCPDGMNGQSFGVNYGFTGPYPNHWFFTDGVTVNAVLELSTGVFMHLSFGNITKYGSWTGGEFITISGGILNSNFHTGPQQHFQALFPRWHGSSYPTSSSSIGNYTGKAYIRTAATGSSTDFVRYPSASSDPNGFFTMGQSSSGSPRCMMADLLSVMPSNSAWRTLLTPTILFFNNGSNRYYPAGHVPNVALTRMTDVMVSGQLIESDWRIFPIVRRAEGSGTGELPASSNWAIAYREVA